MAPVTCAGGSRGAATSSESYRGKAALRTSSLGYVHRLPLNTHKRWLPGQGEPVAVDATAPPAPAAAAPPVPGPSNNAPLAIGAVAAAVVLFAVTRLGGAAPTLATLEQMATPLDVALVNGRPSVVEFYANW